MLPWPDRLAMLLSAYVCDEPEPTEGRAASSPRASETSSPPDKSDLLAHLSRKDEHASSTSNAASAVRREAESGYSINPQLGIHRLQLF